jgi:branched-chain amino acid transport system ATP-binding protein
MSILRLEEIFKDFSGLHVLFGISLDVIDGERHAIIGPNGAGKSTLFNIITGLYKPSRGKILFSDKDITGWSAHKIARIGISRSFQVKKKFTQIKLF